MVKELKFSQLLGWWCDKTCVVFVDVCIEERARDVHWTMWYLEQLPN